MEIDISNLKSKLPSYARDIKINLSNVLTEEGAPGLNISQIAGVALASAYATKNKQLIKDVLNSVKDILDANNIQGVNISSTIMGMNNIYYRFLHLSKDAQYNQLPAGLRMQSMMNHGISEIDFELYSIAVSSITGCGMCIESHNKTLQKKHGVPASSIQSVIRIAAVIHAASQALIMEDAIIN